MLLGVHLAHFVLPVAVLLLVVRRRLLDVAQGRLGTAVAPDPLLVLVRVLPVRVPPFRPPPAAKVRVTQNLVLWLVPPVPPFMPFVLLRCPVLPFTSAQLHRLKPAEEVGEKWGPPELPMVVVVLGPVLVLAVLVFAVVFRRLPAVRGRVVAWLLPALRNAARVVGVRKLSDAE